MTPLVLPVARVVHPDALALLWGVLVGRETERRVLAELLAGARLGGGRALVVSGEAGIGKTSLLGEAEAIASEMLVLRARGVEAERLLPFAGLSQLVRPLLPRLDELPAPQSRALRSALLLEDAEPGPAPTRFAVGAATLGLLSRAAEERPLAVLVDDGHLLDEASVATLVFACRRIGSDPVAALVTVRAGEPDGEAWADLPRLDLAGLDLAAATELLESSADHLPGGAVLRLHRATGGNPLAMLELRGAGLRPGPADSPVPVSEAVGRSFLVRADELSGDARTSLLVAATDGTRLAEVVEACRRLGVAEPGLAEAQDAGLVTLDGERVEFRHPLVRSAVYGVAPPDLRRAVHRALVAVVPSAEPTRLAWHLSECAVPPDDATAGTLEDVARAATSRGAYGVAATVMQRAAELAGTRERRAEDLVEAAFGGWLAGQPRRALELADLALTQEPGPRIRARVQELRGAVLTRSGSLVEAQATLLEAARAVAETEPDLAVSLYSDAVHVSFFLADPRCAMRCCEALEGLLDVVSDPDVVALARMATGMTLILAGHGTAGIERVRAALAPVASGEAADDELLRHPIRLQGALWVRDQGQLRGAVNRALEGLRERAALGSLPVLLTHLGREAATTDRWEDAASAYSEAVRLARETGHSTDLAMALAGWSVLEARRGRPEVCRELADEAALVAGRGAVRIAELWVSVALGDLEAGAGGAAGAARHYETAELLLAETGLADPDQSCVPELVEAYLHLGRPDDAARIVPAHRRLAEAKAEPWALARAERTAGLCAGQHEAERAFVRALQLHDETLDHYEAARTRLAYGARLRRDRRRVDARPLLREALATFEELGARPWADRAAQELEATGETAHRRDLGPVEQLTPQERQIAQLLAAGRTTREAAGALFLSPKTVEYHLRHVYQKLGIRSRGELAETMGGTGRNG